MTDETQTPIEGAVYDEQLRRHNFNPMIEPDDLMDTALNICSALAAVEEWFLQRHEELDAAGFGMLLLVQSAQQAAHYINNRLDVDAIQEAQS